MNVLPLVSVFLILFAIASYTFLHSVKATIQENFHYKGALAVERTFASKVQDELYKNQKGDKEEKRENPSKKDDSATFVSHRDSLRFPNSSKLNIRPLFTEEGNPQLEKVALALLTGLYQGTSIYTEGMQREILDVIIHTSKNNPNVQTFEELLTKIPDNNVPLFYKLIKGTQVYHLSERKGYPPLGDYISLDGKSNKRKSINFYRASRPVLSALFGEKLTELIIAEEKRKWDVDHKKKFLKKEELQAFLTEKCKKNLSDFEALLYFDSTRQKRTQEMVKSEDSALQIRINI